MGRKPNQLILEYFERGPKLEDASNRYQHTCKSCGEKFPKGRIDSLTNHLVKKCPALPLRDRQRAALQLNHLPDLPARDLAYASLQDGQSASLPFAPKQNISALETLAEVSRRHLEFAGNLNGKVAIPRSGRMSTLEDMGAQASNVLEDFLVSDEKPAGIDPNHPSERTDSQGLAWDYSDRHDDPRQQAPPLPPIYSYNNLHVSSPDSPHMPNLSLGTAASGMNTVPEPLRMAASAANELQSIMPGSNIPLDSDAGVGEHNVSDYSFHTQPRAGGLSNTQLHSIDPSLHEVAREASVAPSVGQDVSHHVATFGTPTAGNTTPTQTHFTSGFSVNQKPSKPKVRGRFSDSRRKEVQDVRKKGACIRCRMLKKPCSGETPCSTCANVESARLWKTPCIRTRIAEEFELYSAGLHTVLAFHALGQTQRQQKLTAGQGRIEATVNTDLGLYATFGFLRRGGEGSSPDIDPALFEAGDSMTESSHGLTVLDSDCDDIGGKLEHYMQRLVQYFYESEKSTFVKATLGQATRLVEPGADNLITKVLELWAATCILADPSLDWRFYLNASSPPSSVPISISLAELEADADSSPITRSEKPASYELILFQLRGATEKRAASLAKFIMNDLERRLLQRQQAKPFETFLVAIVLLVCVERMCWLFKLWEGQDAPYPYGSGATAMKPETRLSDGDLHQHNLMGPTDANLDIHHLTAEQVTQSIPPFPSKWPLDRAPSVYVAQGERFSDILVMLLKMRGVPPRTIPRDGDAILTATPPSAPLGERDDWENVRHWYDDIAVTLLGLKEAQERANITFEGKDVREWELRFAGKLVSAGLVAGPV